MRNAVAPVLLALLLLVAGIAALETALLAIAAPLLVYLAAGAAFGPDNPRLEARREMEAERVVPGQPVSVRLTVTNRSPRLEEVFLQEQLPAGAEVSDGSTSIHTSLDPGASFEINYTLRLRRGFHTLPGLSGLAADHFGLWSRPVKGIAPASLAVLPQPARLKQILIRPQQTRLAPGSTLARRGGPGTDFFGVRPYSPGDPLRRINWRASARRGGLFSNDFEQERAADVGLILDSRRRVDYQGRQGALFEFQVTAAATLAENLLRMGNRVSLLVYGGLLDWTYPGYGKIQLERILRVLAAVQTDESLIFDRLEFLPARVFPPHSQIILLSALHPEDLPFLIRLRALGYALTIISANPVSYAAAASHGEAAELPQLGLRLAQLERTYIITGLRQAGIDVLDWDVALPFEQAAGAALTRRGLARMYQQEQGFVSAER